MTTDPATIRPDIAREFLAREFRPDDWVALFAKAYDSGRVLQWVAPVATFGEARWLTWLRVTNEYRFNLYVSVNAMTPHRRQRTRASVSKVRHVFLDVDHDVPTVLGRVMASTDTPLPTVVIHSSPGRVQVLWRVESFSIDEAERLQKHLVRTFGGDRSATAVSQTMRLPGFANHKYAPPPIVGVDYGADRVLGPSDFPEPTASPTETRAHASGVRFPFTAPPDVLDRARRYLAAVPPAVAGERGDLRTFQLCCRLVRGFALEPPLAVALLSDWNARCEPPWTEQELIAKVEHARRYGREPLGGLLEEKP
jgi:hypothetical protein